MVGGGHDRLWYRIWRTVGQTRADLEDEILDDKSSGSSWRGFRI